MSEAIDGSRGLSIAGNWDEFGNRKAYEESQLSSSGRSMAPGLSRKPSVPCQWFVLMEAMTCGDKCKSSPEHLQGSKLMQNVYHCYDN
ncbi:unnamed protein product [Urochloa humidicola]